MHISIPKCHWSVLKLVKSLYTLVEFFIIRKLRFIQWKPSKFCIKLHIQKNGSAGLLFRLPRVSKWSVHRRQFKRIVTKFPAHLRFNFDDAKVYLCRNLLRSSQQLRHQEFSVKSFNFALKTTFKCIPQIHTFRTCKLRKVTAHPKVITGVGSDDLVTAILGNSGNGYWDKWVCCYLLNTITQS